jgi:hypothetical protein
VGFKKPSTRPPYCFYARAFGTVTEPLANGRCSLCGSISRAASCSRHKERRPNNAIHITTLRKWPQLQELIDHLRSDIEKIDEPRCKAMFETSAEVLGGLKKAFEDYETKKEPAWR